MRFIFLLTSIFISSARWRKKKHKHFSFYLRFFKLIISKTCLVWHFSFTFAFASSESLWKHKMCTAWVYRFLKENIHLIFPSFEKKRRSLLEQVHALFHDISYMSVRLSGYNLWPPGPNGDSPSTIFCDMQPLFLWTL